MKGRSKKKAVLIGIPVIFTAAAILIYILGLRQVWDLAYSQWKAAIIKGAPEYTYESMLGVNEQATEGNLYYGEVRFPEVGNQFGEVICEDIDLTAPMYYGDSEEILEKGVGVYTAGSIPGEKGTILAGAHDSTYFAALENIKVSDVITVKTTYGIFEYQVSDIQIVDISTEAWSMESDEEQLVLYTCYPFGATESARTQRYFVYAEKLTGPDIKEAE